MKRKSKSIKTTKQIRRESYEHLRNIKNNNMKKEDKSRFEDDYMDGIGIVNYWVDTWKSFRKKFLIDEKTKKI